MKAKISPSMMCCDPMQLKETLREFEKSGIDYLHIDIMDGIYVPNYALGIDYVRMLRTYTDIPMDIHLMIRAPENKLDWFPLCSQDYVSVHVESTPHIHRALKKIKEKGAKAMLALNPGTPICCIEEVAEDLNGVLIMTVDPGFAGQTLVPQTLQKISRTKAWLCENGYNAVEVEVDGNVSFSNAEKMRAAGADIFVAGTSSIFTRAMPLMESIAKLRQCIQ